MIDPGLEGWLSRLAGFWRDRKWSLVLLLTIAAFGFGVWGSCWHYEEKHLREPAADKGTWADILYLTLQMFALNSSFEQGPKNWPLLIAMFLSPLVTVFTAIMALIGIYREQFQVLWMSWFYRKHTVICGVGRHGFQLIKDLSGRRQVVAIEKDEENDFVTFARDYGAIVLIGDATDRRTLAKARVGRAAQLFALCAEDLTNLLIASRAGVLANQDPVPSLAHVHVSDLRLWDLFKRQSLAQLTSQRFHAQFFNIFVSAARLALEQCPLEPAGYGLADQRDIHLVILGFGHMGESIAVQALEVGHFNNSRGLRVTVMDREAHKRREIFQARYPQAGKVAPVEFRECELDGAMACRQLESTPRDEILNVAVCLDDDSTSLALGMELAELLGERAFAVRVRMAQESGLPRFSAWGDAARRSANRLSIFGMIDQVCTERNLVGDELDLLAREVHEAYRGPRLQRLAPEARKDLPPNLRPWEELDEEYRDFDRQQADHITVKLRALNCYAAAEPLSPADQPVAAFDEKNEVEPLAAVEHRRWCASHYMAGWVWGAEKNKDLKQHWCLVPWEQLPPLDEDLRRAGRKAVDDEPFQETARRTVRNIFNLLSKVGTRVYRRADTRKA